jgi:hypothetical protein
VFFGAALDEIPVGFGMVVLRFGVDEREWLGHAACGHARTAFDAIFGKRQAM